MLHGTTSIEEDVQPAPSRPRRRAVKIATEKVTHKGTKKGKAKAKPTEDEAEVEPVPEGEVAVVVEVDPEDDGEVIDDTPLWVYFKNQSKGLQFSDDHLEQHLLYKEVDWQIIEVIRRDEIKVKYGDFDVQQYGANLEELDFSYSLELQSSLPNGMYILHKFNTFVYQLQLFSYFSIFDSHFHSMISVDSNI